MLWHDKTFGCPRPCASISRKAPSLRLPTAAPPVPRSSNGNPDGRRDGQGVASRPPEKLRRSVAVATSCRPRRADARLSALSMSTDAISNPLIGAHSQRQLDLALISCHAASRFREEPLQPPQPLAGQRSGGGLTQPGSSRTS